MSYLTVLPLADVKTYLRIDDTQNETDAEITSMINSAFRYIERVTNILVYDRSKEYIVNNRCVYVYDYPVNSVTKGIDEDGADVALVFKTDYDLDEKHGYKVYYNIDGDAVKLVLNVGYTVASDVPEDLIEVAKIMVKVMYYEQETNQSFKELLPHWAKEYLDTNRRFIF